MAEERRMIAECLDTGHLRTVVIEDNAMVAMSGKVTSYELRRLPLDYFPVRRRIRPLPLDTAKDSYNLYDLPAWRALYGA